MGMGTPRSTQKGTEQEEMMGSVIFDYAKSLVYNN